MMSAKRALLALAVTLFASSAIPEKAAAQDLLPRDNGIFKYHEPPRWRESESHPLRTLAYIVHPVGWVAREAIYRPFSYLVGSTEFTRSFFGFREPFDYREPYCFFDSDVVPDCRTIAPYNSLGKAPGVETPGSEAALAPERQVYFPDVNFDFDKSNLNELGKGRTRQVAQLLSSVPNLKVVVEGHTDYLGSDDYNMKLGQRRAESVIKELTELGVDPARMTPVSYGEGKPLFTEEEDWARAANRRAQFAVQGAATPAVAPAPEAAPAK